MEYYVCSVPRMKSSVHMVRLINPFKVNGVAFGEAGVKKQLLGISGPSGKF